MKGMILRLLCLAALAMSLCAVVPASPPQVPLCPAATALQRQVMNVAPNCVATTVGLVSRSGEAMMQSIESGSGVLISADGLIMTAGHVIEKPGNALTIRFADGRVYQGVAVGLDHASDTGLAKITDAVPAGGWPFAEIAPDDSAKLGDWVLATGNPGSIVLDRNPPLRLGRVTAHDSRKIETNCALEPGDSGGPLFDLQGRVIGIHSRILTSRSTDVHFKEYQSMHVPVSLFTTEWKDLLAGENAHPGAVIGRSARPGGPGRMRNARALLFRQAIDKLLAQKDPEAIQLMTDAQKNGGRMQLTPQLIEHLIQKAGLSGSSTQPTTGRSQAAAPSTAPAAATAARPATSPSQFAQTGKPAAEASPTFQPATRPVQKGIAAALRPAIAAQLRRSLQAQFPDARITDDLLNRIMDRSSFEHGRLNIVTVEQDLKDMGVTPSSLAERAEEMMQADRTQVELGKTSLQTLSLFVPAIEAAGDCAVEIFAGGKPVLLGTIVSSDGFIVTKASDLPGRFMVVLPDGRSLHARVIGTDEATDLALLKVPASGLTSVHFSHDAPLGEWLASLTSDPNQPAIGLVSDIARPIPLTFTHFAGEQKLVLGVGFTGPTLVVGMVTPGMPAEAAGLKIGDDIYELDGEAVKDSADFLARMKKHKTGDTLSIKVHRLYQDLELKPTLGQVKATTETTNGIGEADNVAGGRLSKRRMYFPMAIQTDAAVWADQIGGPLINLQGQTVGVTIARYDRVCTFALPAELVEKTVEKLKAAAFSQ